MVRSIGGATILLGGNFHHPDSETPVSVDESRILGEFLKGIKNERAAG